MTLTHAAPVPGGLGRTRRRPAEPLPTVRLEAGLPLPEGDFVALAPGAEATLMTLDLPAGLRGAAREAVALRQAVDRLGGDAARLELRPVRMGGRTHDWTAVLVVERATAERWRAEIAPARSRCRAILPDYLALPTAPRLWTVATEAGEGAVRVRLGPDDGFTAEPDLAAMALERAIAAAPAPAAVLRLGPPEPAVDAALATLTGVPVAAAAAALPRPPGPAQMFAHGELALDLATDLRARAQALAARLATLRTPAVLGLAALAAWAAAVEVEARRDLGRAAALRAEITAEVRRDFLPSGPILDIAAQVTRELDRRRRAAGSDTAAPPPLAVLRAASGVLAGAGAEIAAVMQRPGGALAFDLVAEDFAALDALAADLRGLGVGVRIERSSAEARGRVNGTLVLATER